MWNSPGRPAELASIEPESFVGAQRGAPRPAAGSDRVSWAPASPDVHSCSYVVPFDAGCLRRHALRGFKGIGIQTHRYGPFRQRYCCPSASDRSTKPPTSSITDSGRGVSRRRSGSRSVLSSPLRWAVSAAGSVVLTLPVTREPAPAAPLGAGQSYHPGATAVSAVDTGRWDEIARASNADGSCPPMSVVPFRSDFSQA